MDQCRVLIVGIVSGILVLALSGGMGTVSGQAADATLKGTITDPTGAVVPTATVTVKKRAHGMGARDDDQ